jgi:alpha-ketoglutarate-dependent taurine dioxygenase
MGEIPYETSGALPLTVRPRPGDAAGADRAALCAWLRANRQWVQQKLTEHGALRFRGFDIREAIEFEEVAAALDPDLKNEYLGTSPRDSVTDYVFNASELPDYFPIAQHCEMSFCARPPRRVFFCCLDAPAEGSGETPLCDFRAVWRDLDPAVRERFEAGGIRIVRNYAGPGGERDDDPTQLKPWPEMFLTTDRDEVVKKCREEGFTPTWLAGDGLRLESTQAVTRDHPVTGEAVWHNHITTFHVTTAAGEYARIAALRPSERHRGVHRMAQDLEKRLREQPSEERSMHSTYLDGTEFPDADIEAVRDTVWKHMVIEPWRRGDVVAIDNHSVSHGRMPYEGPRRVVVAWA